MHRIWKALRDRRGFTLIEIAIVIAIIGILLLIALPLFTGARNRAYIAEARQITSEWKALAFTCLVEKNFAESKCDTNAKIGWTAPDTSAAWTWASTVFGCGTTDTVTVTDGSAPAAGTPCADSAASNSYFALRVPKVSGVTDHDYVLVLRTNTGKVQESTNAQTVPTP